MGKTFDHLDTNLEAWINKQKLFFVSTAPLSGDGLINCSPKGMDTFRVLGKNEIAYLDLIGSGIETIAHLRENGRITIMFCAFSGPPKILRLYGKGQVYKKGSKEFSEYCAEFPDFKGARAIVKVQLHRIEDSCGFGVPEYAFRQERDHLVRWAAKKNDTDLNSYMEENNVRSLDGLPGLIKED